MCCFDCLTPSFPLIGSARIFYVASCSVITITSIALQIIFALICQKMKGWKSDFAFYLLQIMAFFSVMSYIGYLLTYIHGLILFDSPVLSRVTGANFQGTYFAFVLANLFLHAHRLFYTLLPLRAQLIVTTSIEKMCIAFIFIFYGTYVVIAMTPLTSVESCAAHFYFYYGDGPLYLVISWINRVSNYVTGIAGVTAYIIIFTTLFVKGSLTFRRNGEIRMTVQAAVVSVLELLFFVFWEFGKSSAFPVFWQKTLNDYLMLIYYDVLIIPYMIFNESVKTELKSIFRRKSPTTPLVITLEWPLFLQRRSV